MQFNDYVRAVRRYWTSILATIGVFVVIAIAVILVSPKTYSATAELFVAPGSNPSSVQLTEGSEFFQERVKTYALIVDSEVVLDPVIADLGIDETSRELAQRVTASAPVDTVLLRISVTDTSADGAADAANAVAEQFIEIASGLESVGEDTDASIVSISIVQTARVPDAPISPNRRLILVLAVLLGGIAGVVIAVVRDLLDDHLRSDADILRVSGAAIVGRVPTFRDGVAPTPWAARTDEPFFEAIRQLRTKVVSAGADDRRRTFVVTSPLRGDGKSTVALGLALSLSDAGHRVCLVDADLRNPRVAALMDIDDGVGLSGVLDGTARPSDVIHVDDNSGVYVIPSGDRPPNPSELIASTRATELFRWLEDQFDFVIVDSPSALAATDALAIPHERAAVVMVVAMRGSASATSRQLSAALELVDGAGAHLWGIVANMHTGVRATASMGAG